MTERETRASVAGITRWLAAAFGIATALGCDNADSVGDECVRPRGEDAYCNAGLVCLWLSQPPPGQPYYDIAECAQAGGQRVGETCNGDDPAFACASGLDCGPDSLCQGGSQCEVDLDCTAGFQCEALDAAGQTYCPLSCDPGSGGRCPEGYHCAADRSGCSERQGLSCYVDSTDVQPCGRSGACSADSRTCVIPAACSAPCGAYACNTVCAVSGASDADCSADAVCNTTTSTCTTSVGETCDPGSDSATQCGQGSACAPASSTCVLAAPCTTGADCGAYECADGYCVLTCTQNVLPCAVGKVCDLMSHECE